MKRQMEKNMANEIETLFIQGSRRIVINIIRIMITPVNSLHHHACVTTSCMQNPAIGITETAALKSSGNFDVSTL